MAAVITKQWVLTLAQIFEIAGFLPPGGSRNYMLNPTGTTDELLVVSEVKTAGPKFDVLDKKVFNLKKQQIVNFLNEQGQNVPANNVMFFDPSQAIPVPPIIDRVVIAEDTKEGRA